MATDPQEYSGSWITPCSKHKWNMKEKSKRFAVHAGWVLAIMA